MSEEFAAENLSAEEHLMSILGSAVLAAYDASSLCGALEISLFDRIPPEGATALSLSRDLGISYSLMLNVLGALTRQGILVGSEQRYRLNRDYEPYLKQGPSYLGHWVLWNGKRAKQFWRLPDVLAGRDLLGEYSHHDTKLAEMSSYLSGIEGLNRPYFDELFSEHAEIFAGSKTLLDVGGGHGYFCRKFLSEAPGRIAVVVDVASAVEYSRQVNHDLLETESLRLEVGDALTFQLDEKFDLVLLSDVLHYFNPEEKRRAVGNAWRHVAPGGTLLLFKFSLDDYAASPQFNACFSLDRALTCPGAYLETDRELSQLVADELGLDARLINIESRKTLAVVKKG